MKSVNDIRRALNDALGQANLEAGRDADYALAYCTLRDAAHSAVTALFLLPPNTTPEPDMSMTQNKLENLLAAISWAKHGKDIQFRRAEGSSWFPIDKAGPAYARLKDGNAHASWEYRLAPEVVKYRRFTYRGADGSLHVNCVYRESVAREVPGWKAFVRWIDNDWVTEEV